MNTSPDWSHSVTVDDATLTTAHQDLTVMLIRQNDQITAKRRGGGRVAVLNLAITLLAGMSVLTLGLFGMSVVTGDPRPTLLVPTTVAMVGTVLLFVVRQSRNSISSAAFTGIDRLLERTAKTLLSHNRRTATYTSHYRTEAGQWVGEWQKAKQTVHRWSIDPTAYRFAIVGETSVGLWTNPRRQRPATLWIIDPGHREEIAERLLRAGVDVIDLPLDAPRSSETFKRMTTQ